MEYNHDLLLNCFNRFTKYLNDNNSIIIFKYEDDKVQYCIKDNHHNKWDNWYNEYEPIKDIDFKDERLNFFIGKHDTFFSCPFRNESKYQIVNKCINFLCDSVSLEELAMKMDLMGI